MADEKQVSHTDEQRTQKIKWIVADTSVEVIAHVKRFIGFPAVEWLLEFENTGDSDSPVLSDICALDLIINAPLNKNTPYCLHRTNGAPSNPSDFEPSLTSVNADTAVTLSGGGGRSSNSDFPFFRIDTGAGVIMVAVGWSGQWYASIASPDGTTLRVKAGIERACFFLKPGERVRMPRMLLVHHQGDPTEVPSVFRNLIHSQYCVKRQDAAPEPILFSNTCFTRKGAWLNECNAENQISLIRAYADLGLEAVITDAGWFEGGWPQGAGNWSPRSDAYPEGMEPVAAAAHDAGIQYGLWFEPERMTAGSLVHREHPEWALASDETLYLADAETHLFDFGNADARDWIFDTVKRFMDIEGFSVYRQDLNIDPLPFWRDNDEPGRSGITEIKYITGLYEYWDRIRTTWPGCIMEECAGGGRRIDLETIMRFDIHQKTDYWFDSNADQAHLWGLSQYLPNNVFVAHIDSLDEYAFHSALASSLCIGWIADDPAFDTEKARQFVEQYRNVRHLLTGDWYPLLPYTRDPDTWNSMQFHRPDLNEGLVLAFRHEESQYLTTICELRGLDAEKWYEVEGDDSEEPVRVTGDELMEGLTVTIPEPRTSAMIRYLAM